MLFFLISIAIIFFILALLIQRGGGMGFPWIEFYVRGKESGFKFSEINLLRQVAVENNLRNPVSLFWSERQLDRSIRGTMIRMRAKGIVQEPRSVEFLGKLFDFRKQVEFNLPKYRMGLRSSRDIVTSQRIKIPLEGVGVFNSQVVENMRRYMAISHPEGTKALPPGFSWEGQKIQVYFWRQEDAGYNFESKVIGDYMGQQYPILHITHADNLVRNQKRGSIRVELSNPAKLYPLKTIDESNENVEASSGYRGRMLDLSEDGFAVIVGGRAKAGLPLKIQFNLSGVTLVMCGVVKAVTLNQRNNQSTLHVQAVKPSEPIRIHILTYVYGIFKDEGRMESPARSRVPETSSRGGPQRRGASAAQRTGGQAESFSMED